MNSHPEQINVRIPGDLRSWLENQKTLNRSSLSSEVTRCIRERKVRDELSKEGFTAPDLGGSQGEVTA